MCHFLHLYLQFYYISVVVIKTAFYRLPSRIIRPLSAADDYRYINSNVGQHYHYTAHGWCVRLLFEACALHGYA